MRIQHVEIIGQPDRILLLRNGDRRRRGGDFPIQLDKPPLVGVVTGSESSASCKAFSTEALYAKIGWFPPLRSPGHWPGGVPAVKIGQLI